MKWVALMIVGCIAVCTAQAQYGGGTVYGTVVDRDSGRPLAGANVVLEGTVHGAACDIEGRFTIQGLPPGSYTLRASFVGYQSDSRSVAVREDSAMRVAFALVPVLLHGQPITVTATRGRERETPVTFATLEAQQLRDRYTTQDIPVLLSELPSSTFYSESGNGIGYTYLNIRGFDSRRVAVMVNGIPQNDPEDHNVYWLDMPDLAASLEDIQVQRGAGSAFYGPPAIGGSVNLVTSNFGAKRSVELFTGFGSYGTRKYSASFNSGLVGDRYAFRGQLSKIQSDGYRDRAWVDFSSYFLGVVRYDETMTTQFNFYGGPVADGLAYYGIPKADVANRSARRENPIKRPEELENFSQPHAELLHEWRLSPRLTMNNTVFLVIGSGFFDYDGSWAPASYFRITPAYGFPVTGDPDTVFIPGALIRAEVDNIQYGWLPRLTLNHGNGEFIVGAELRVHRSEHWGRLQWFSELPLDVPYDYRYYNYRGAKDMASVYAQEMLGLQPDLTLMLNLQYAYSQYHLYDEKYIGNDFRVPYNFLIPRVGLNYNIDDHWNTYVGMGVTSREPRLVNLYDAAEASTPASLGAVVPQFAQNANGTYDFSAPLVTPERLFNLELGTGLQTENVRASANFYWMEFYNEIVKSGRVDRFGQPVTGNADRTRHVGIELAGRWAFLSSLEVAGNVTVSRNRFIRYTDYSTGLPLQLDGNPIAGFPEVLANMRVTYRGNHLSASLLGRFVGKQYTDNFESESNTVDPSFVSDAWVAYRLADALDESWLEARVQVNNMFDVLYAAYGEGDQFFVGAERNVFLSITIGL